MATSKKRQSPKSNKPGKSSTSLWDKARASKNWPKMQQALKSNAPYKDNGKGAFKSIGGLRSQTSKKKK